MLDFLGVATADRAEFEGRLADGRGMSAAFGRVERGASLFVFIDLDLGARRSRLEEHGFEFLFEHQRAFGSHHHFAVVAEAISIDRRVADDDLLLRIGNDSLDGVGPVAWPGELEHAVHVVFAIAIEREQAAAAYRGDGQRRGMVEFAIFGGCRADQDSGGIELMAAQLGHQPRAGAIPEPPTDQLFERRPLVAARQSQLLVTMFSGVDLLVLDLGLNLGDELDRMFVLRSGGVLCIDHRFQVGNVLIEFLETGNLGEWILVVGRQRHLPAIVARQIAPMPLSADVVNVSQETMRDQPLGVVVEDAVIALMTDGEKLAGLLGHAAHLLALVDAVSHQLFGEHVLALAHGLDRRLGMEVKRQRDDDGLDIRVVQQIHIAVFIDLDVLLGLVARLPAVNRHQAGAAS